MATAIARAASVTVMRSVRTASKRATGPVRAARFAPSAGRRTLSVPAASVRVAAMAVGTVTEAATADAATSASAVTMTEC